MSNATEPRVDAPETVTEPAAENPEHLVTETPTAETTGDDTADVQATIEAAVAEWKDRYQRLGAEFENYKKRAARDFEVRIGLVKEDLIQAFLPIFDDVERTLKVAETATDLEAIQKGIQMVVKNYRNILDKQGITVIESVGQVFDSEQHEAITSAPAADADQKGKVVQEIRKGYRYNDKVIRTAQVIIGE